MHLWHGSYFSIWYSWSFLRLGKWNANVMCCIDRNAVFECISLPLTQQTYADSKPKTLSGMENKFWTHYHTSVRKSLVHCLLPWMISMIRTSCISSLSILHRYVMSVWRDKAMLQRQFRLMEQEAQNHYQHFLQFKVKLPQNIFILTSAKTLLIFFLVKVFIAWREETASAVSPCRQQREALTRFQMFQNKGTADLIST